MNPSGISNKSVLGRLMRLPLKLIPRGAILPILQGPLRGKRWVAGSSSHGCWLGSYEFEKQRALIARLRPGNTFFDVGAHVGFYTLLAAQLVAESGKVYAFEPLPENVTALKRHMVLNKVDNVTILEAAVGSRPGQLWFRKAESTSMGHLDTSGDLQVDVVALDDLLASDRITPPDMMKIDVEGAELEVLQGAELMLKQHSPTIFLAVHSPNLRDECTEYLRTRGYTLSQVSSDDELLAYT